MAVRITRVSAAIAGTEDTATRITRISAAVAGTTAQPLSRLQRIGLQILMDGSGTTIVPTPATAISKTIIIIPIGCIENPNAGQEQDIKTVGWTIINGSPQCFDETDLCLFTRRDFVKEMEEQVAAGTLIVKDLNDNPVASIDIQEFFRDQEILAKEILSVGREQFDISTPGLSVITNILAGPNISISGTGADTGTGTVTINTGESASPSSATSIGETVDPTVVIA